MSELLDWDEAEEVVTGDGGLFYELQDGLNVFRVVSPAFRFDVHWFKFHESDTTVKRFISPREGDPLKARGETPQSRFAFKVLPDNAGQGSAPLTSRPVQSLEVGPLIYNEIIKLAKDPDYGHPKAYDIKVTKTGKGRNTDYSVLARPIDKCEKMTAEVEAYVASKNLDLGKLYKSNTPEEMLEYINNPPGGKSGKTSARATSTQQQAPQSIRAVDDDLFDE